ncbi:hypothetical protein JSO19_02850 [Leucobacter sp. UCMA 4100]|uniref:hypothetical protein n=1 Tax=Leucobacter sp. UCMA 4100 TaxID=2810534 RepID=UPI0022EA5F41|nr:hypothetical protein [Leucobacter sp. UCMA 4100]MDA3146316.1 hypothetical protein [Leucobacter sp. UCMA 4100]
MKKNTVALALAATASISLLTGCAPEPTTGTVSVQLRALSKDLGLDEVIVTIVGPDDKKLHAETLTEGVSMSFEDVPFGWITIDAAGVCSVGGELSAESLTLGLVVDGKHCEVTN